MFHAGYISSIFLFHVPMLDRHGTSTSRGLVKLGA